MDDLGIILHGFHCIKGVRIRSYSSLYFPAFRLNTERYGVSFRIQSKFEYEHFLCSENHAK